MVTTCPAAKSYRPISWQACGSRPPDQPERQQISRRQKESKRNCKETVWSGSFFFGTVFVPEQKKKETRNRAMSTLPHVRGEAIKKHWKKATRLNVPLFQRLEIRRSANFSCSLEILIDGFGGPKLVKFSVRELRARNKRESTVNWGRSSSTLSCLCLHCNIRGVKTRPLSGKKSRRKGTR